MFVDDFTGMGDDDACFMIDLVNSPCSPSPRSAQIVNKGTRVTVWHVKDERIRCSVGRGPGGGVDPPDRRSRSPLGGPNKVQHLGKRDTWIISSHLSSFKYTVPKGGNFFLSWTWDVQEKIIYQSRQ